MALLVMPFTTQVMISFSRWLSVSCSLSFSSSSSVHSSWFILVAMVSGSSHIERWSSYSFNELLSITEHTRARYLVSTFPFSTLNAGRSNQPPKAGQTVFHFHMHIIPRIKGDTVNVGWVPGTADNDTIASIVEKVTPYL